MKKKEGQGFGFYMRKGGEVKCEKMKKGREKGSTS